MKLILADKTEYVVMPFASLNNISVSIKSYADMENLETALRKSGNLRNISFVDEGTENEYKYTDLIIVDPIFNMAQKTSDNKVLVSFGVRKMTEEEKKIEKMAQQQESQSEDITLAISYLSDEEALTVKNLHPSFEELVEKKYTAKNKGFRFMYKDDLYKTAQDNITFQEQYPPGTGMESLYTRIDETHAGTMEDPIPWVPNMQPEKDRYYIEETLIAKCIENPGQPLYNKLSELCPGRYFEKVE